MQQDGKRMEYFSSFLSRDFLRTKKMMNKNFYASHRNFFSYLFFRYFVFILNDVINLSVVVVTLSSSRCFCIIIFVIKSRLTNVKCCNSRQNCKNLVFENKDAGAELQFTRNCNSSSYNSPDNSVHLFT